MNQNAIHDSFVRIYQKEPDAYLRCGGRFEILGNHTDHNHGKCIAATCDMSIYSAVKKRNDLLVGTFSEGFKPFVINLDSLELDPKETGTSQGLIRGIAYYLKKQGYNIGGFDIYMKSTIFKGAGVSSSAAYELLIGQVLSTLFNDNKIDRIVLAKAGQFAENVYYSKNCGLLDQIGVSWGGIVSIDFKNISNPVVKKKQIDLKDHEFILVNTGGDHSKMSPLYSQIPVDMKIAAKALGVEYLNETTCEELEKHKNDIPPLPYARAYHFFKECERVDKAMATTDVETLKECINGSRRSCTEYLKNMMADKYEGSPLEACELVDKLTNNEGAAKINGGGFAGSIVCLIPIKYENVFIEEMSKKYGANNVYKVNVDNVGVGPY